VELVDLRRELKDVHLETRHDVLLSWTLEPLGKFSARSLYRKLGHTEETLWVALVAIPLKIMVFLWQLMHKWLPSNDNIRHRKGPSSGIFFNCVLAKFMWSGFGYALFLLFGLWIFDL
jgi:hypothetical protein